MNSSTYPPSASGAGSNDRDRSVCGNGFAVDIEQPRAGGSPGDLRDRFECRARNLASRARSSCSIVMCWVRALYIPDPMHQPRFHMAANLGAGLRCQRNTAAAHGFRDHQTKPFFDAGQNQNVALSHQFRHVVPMPEDLHTRMREHRCQFFLVRRQEFARDEESAVFEAGDLSHASSA